MTKKDKKIILDAYRRLFKRYFECYQAHLDKARIDKDKVMFSRCEVYREMYIDELRGMIELLECIEVFDFAESKKELREVDDMFCMDALPGMHYCKEDVSCSVM